MEEDYYDFVWRNITSEMRHDFEMSSFTTFKEYLDDRRERAWDKLSELGQADLMFEAIMIKEGLMEND